MKIIEGNKKFTIFIGNLCIYSLIIFFEIFSSIPIHYFNNITILPDISSILIFFFLIISKEKVNYFLLFILGFLFDTFNLLPLGSTALIWLITSKIIIFLRKHLYTPDSLVIDARDFSIYTILNNIFAWLLFSIIFKNIYPISTFLFQIILNIVFFVILYKLLRKVEEAIR